MAALGIARQVGLVSPAYGVYRPLANSKLEPEFADRLLRIEEYKAEYIARSTGVNASRLRLYPEQFLRIPILLPPKDKQQKIARYLGNRDRKINRFIRNRRRLIEVLNEQKQAIINRAVTRGLDPDVPLKPSGIEWLGEIPEHWRMVPLGHISKVQTGITLGKNYIGQSVVQRPYLRVANVQAGRTDLRIVKSIELPPGEASSCESKDGDVLMTEGGDIDKLGRGCVWHGEITNCLHQNHVFAVRVDHSRLHPEYLTALMASKHGRTYFEITAKRTTNLASTNSSKIRAFSIPLPPLDEQLRLLEIIGTETRTTDNFLDRATREITLIREYRTRLIADVVTGQVDVRHLAPSAPLPADDALDEDLEADVLLDDEDADSDPKLENEADAE